LLVRPDWDARLHGICESENVVPVLRDSRRMVNGITMKLWLETKWFACMEEGARATVGLAMARFLF
jgi:hypothetical protein